MQGISQNYWGIFLYANADKKIRRAQWSYLQQQRCKWGDMWFLRGDMNEIRENLEKKGGTGRSAGSFRRFNDFIRTMNMEKVRFVGREWTWANNRVGEGFVEERLNRFFASTSWHYQFPNAIVNYIQKQASDHILLILETKPNCQSRSKRFYFDKRFIELPGFEQTILDA